MGKRNGKRHNFFTEMAMSSAGGTQRSAKAHVSLGARYSRRCGSSTAWLEGTGEQTEPDASGCVPASACLQLHENAQALVS